MANFDMDMADIKPTLLSWILVGLMATTFIVFGKYVFTRWKIPGVTDVFLAV